MGELHNWSLSRCVPCFWALIISQASNWRPFPEPSLFLLPRNIKEPNALTPVIPLSLPQKPPPLPESQRLENFHLANWRNREKFEKQVFKYRKKFRGIRSILYNWKRTDRMEEIFLIGLNKLRICLAELLGELLGEYHKIETITTLNMYISAYQDIIRSYMK